jgi:predicted component of type VI protein secretion system
MKEKAQKAVDLIIDDLSDRRGLKHEWHQIDPEIQAEIKEEWVGLLLSVFKGNQ